MITGLLTDFNKLRYAVLNDHGFFVLFDNARFVNSAFMFFFLSPLFKFFFAKLCADFAMTSLLLKTILYENDVRCSRKMKCERFQRDPFPVGQLSADNLCRACGDTGEAHIFDSHEGRSLAHDMLECCNVKVEEQDGLPAWLCGVCLQLLRGAVRFREMCLAAELRLQGTVKTDTQDHTLLDLDSEDDDRAEADYLYEQTNEKGEPPPCNTAFSACQYCNKKFKNKKAYKDHTKHCELPTVAARSKLKVNRSDGRENGGDKIGKPHLCETCGKAFRTVAHLKIHSSVHETVFPYRCLQCAYRGKTPALLREHARMHASKAYMCARCPAAFRTKSNLNKHMLTHRTEQPAQCSLCEKVLRHSSSLKAHMKQVHGERPVVCDVCGKTIKTKKQLSRHRAKIHNLRTERTGRRPLYLQFPDDEEPPQPLDA